VIFSSHSYTPIQRLESRNGLTDEMVRSQGVFPGIPGDLRVIRGIWEAPMEIKGIGGHPGNYKAFSGIRGDRKVSTDSKQR
jgi:hypothetical protein